MPSRLILSGLRSIEECLRYHPEKIAKLLISPGRLPLRVEQLKNEALRLGVKIESSPKASDSEESILAILHDYQYADFYGVLSELKENIGQNPTVLALDGIVDPQNLGAILRTAAFMGVESVLLPKDRSAAINTTVYRIASGGLEHIKVCQVTNLVSAFAELKELGFWTVGFSEHASDTMSKLDRERPYVLVLGNEEKGIRPLVSKNCDFLVRFSSAGGLKSLNASVSAALAMAWAKNFHYLE